MKALIIDDEEKSRITLRNFVEKYTTGVEIAGEADGVDSGFRLIRNQNPDLVFLDIEMKDGTGFDLLSLLKPISFRVVFITAFDQYAVKAFNFSASDYLLKPLDPSRLVEAVNKIKSESKNDQLHERLEVLLENNNGIQKLALPATDGLIMVKIDEIVRCESEINYTRFYLSTGKKHLSTKTLKEYDEMLSGLNFYRIHKSHLINLGFVARYIKGDGGSVVLDDKTELEVARRRKEGLLSALKK